MPGFRLVLAFALALAGLHAYAATLDLTQLMHMLSLTTEVETPYIEKKYSSLLTEPLVSSGVLVYHRPNTVEKNMLVPRKESFRIAGEDLIVVRNGVEKRYPLNSQPLLSAFAASLRGVLSGDLSLLQKHYQITLEGEEEGWGLDMQPLDREISQYVERILVTGRAGHVRQIEVREANGDRSVLQVR